MTAVLAGITIDLTRRQRPASNPIRVVVIDRADRSLIRLRQLPTADRYVTIDDSAGIEQLVELVEQVAVATPRRPGLLLLVVNELGRLLDFLTRSGHRDLARRLGSVVALHDGDRLMVAASCHQSELLPANVRSAFRSSLACDTDGHGNLADPLGERLIDLRSWSPDRVTTAVAEVTQFASS